MCRVHEFKLFSTAFTLFLYPITSLPQKITSSEQKEKEKKNEEKKERAVNRSNNKAKEQKNVSDLLMMVTALGFKDLLFLNCSKKMVR